MVDIDLHQTDLEDKPFSTVNYGVVAESIEKSGEWLNCAVDDMVFKGRGGPEKLQEILSIFLDWAEVE